MEVNDYKSHPSKSLIKHTCGVVEKVKKRTNTTARASYYILGGVVEKVKKRTDSKMAETAALFHDFGKMNPNFQAKLNGENVSGYSNHAYLSAYIFLMCCCQKNSKVFKLNPNELSAVSRLIAHHHGNLPDFDGTGTNDEEEKKLFEFLQKNSDFPAFMLLSKTSDLEFLEFQTHFREKFLDIFSETATKKIKINNHLDFFLDVQSAFAHLIEADKRDAGDNENYQKSQSQKVLAEELEKRLEEFYKKVENDSELSRVRTEMRKNAVLKLGEGVKKKERVFSLTAPTGSGKTLMLLSLANELIKFDKNLSILYVLPFLTITEQVEKVCRMIFSGKEEIVVRIDSNSENEKISDLQKQLDTEPQKLEQLLKEKFSEETFDEAFIITTSVRFFETLLSNKNNVLLKLPNFANRVFLIDEIQSLPPRLYTFFVAFLDAFCKKFNSYAIVSTATMPNFKINENEKAKSLFKDFEEPSELLNNEYFKNQIFNRYKICKLEGKMKIEELAEHILKQNESCLIILNTIGDTKLLFEKLKNESVVLLNTHFTLKDRKAKIECCKSKLEAKEQVILISTQLIEAGVDIDFPVVYRDFCPLPSLIQSAGRCNRNNNLEKKGRVFFFELTDEEGNSKFKTIYRTESDKTFVLNSRDWIQKETTEPESFEIQKKHFEEISSNLIIGQIDDKINLVESIKKLKFEEVGKFKLIEETFGKEVTYFVSENEEDVKDYECLKVIVKQEFGKSFEDFVKRKTEIQAQLKKMNSKMVRVRKSQKNEGVLPNFSDEVLGIRLLSEKSAYSFGEGIRINSENLFF